MIRDATFKQAWSEYKLAVDDVIILRALKPYIVPADDILKQRAIANWWGDRSFTSAFFLSLPKVHESFYLPTTIMDELRIPIPVIHHAPIVLPFDHIALPSAELMTQHKTRYYVVRVLLEFSSVRHHANILLFDYAAIPKVAHLYEPHGAMWIAAWYSPLAQALNVVVFKDGFIVKSMPATIPGPQNHEVLSPIYRHIIQMGKRGKCSVWCLLFLHAVSLGFQPARVISLFNQLLPNTAMFAVRAYTSFIMTELYRADSPARQALGPIEKLPLQLQQVLNPISLTQKKDQDDVSEGPGIGGRGYAHPNESQKRKSIDDTKHPAQVRLKKPKLIHRATQLNHYRVGNFHLPKNDFHLARLFITVQHWVKLTSREHVYKLVNEEAKRKKMEWVDSQYSPLDVMVTKEIPLKSKQKYSDKELVQELYRIMKEGLLAGKSPDESEWYIAYANYVPYDWASKERNLLDLEGHVHNKSQTKLFDFYLRPRNAKPTRALAPEFDLKYYWGKDGDYQNHYRASPYDGEHSSFGSAKLIHAKNKNHEKKITTSVDVTEIKLLGGPKGKEDWAVGQDLSTYMQAYAFLMSQDPPYIWTQTLPPLCFRYNVGEKMQIPKSDHAFLASLETKLWPSSSSPSPPRRASVNKKNKEADKEKEKDQSLKRHIVLATEWTKSPAELTRECKGVYLLLRPMAAFYQKSPSPSDHQEQLQFLYGYDLRDPTAVYMRQVGGALFALIINAHLTFGGENWSFHMKTTRKLTHTRAADFCCLNYLLRDDIYWLLRTDRRKVTRGDLSNVYRIDTTTGYYRYANAKRKDLRPLRALLHEFPFLCRVLYIPEWGHVGTVIAYLIHVLREAATSSDHRRPSIGFFVGGKKRGTPTRYRADKYDWILDVLLE